MKSAFYFSSPLNHLILQITENEFFNFNTQMTPTEICDYCVLNGWQFVLYRLPKDNKFTLIIQSGSYPALSDLDLIFKTYKGFVVAPFTPNSATKIQFIHSDYKLEFHSWEEQLAFPHFIKTLNPKFQFLAQKENKEFSTQKQAFIEHIEQAKQAFADKILEKVVLSAIQVIPAPQFDNLVLFKKMANAYPGVMLYMLYLQDNTMWMGATPELLLHQAPNQLTSVALAGTKAISNSQNGEHWSEKEIIEQQLVKQHVEKCFKKVYSNPVEISSTKTFSTGHLLHLKTDFLLRNLTEEMKNSFSVFLQLLHPTPAVAGTPTKTAIDFILQHENHDRAYYSGFLGPVNIQSQIHLYVNLRCLKYVHEHLYFYSGAGITPNSIPEKEWNEIMMKAQTLIKLL